MKTKLFILTVCIAILSMSTSAGNIKNGHALKGTSLTEFGDYTIVKADVPMVINNVVLETYQLVYAKSNCNVRVGLVKEKKCTTFLVRTDGFEVEYTCNKGMFGVQKVERKYQQVPTIENDCQLDRTGYFAQRVICQNKKSKDELLGLIACYFPNLVKEEYQANL